MKSFLLSPAALDVIVEPWWYLFTPAGAILSAILVAAVVTVTVLLIRRFFGKGRSNDRKDDK